MDSEKYTEWRKKMAEQRKACLACELEDYMNAPGVDFEAMQPCADPHEGLYCKRKGR